MRQLCPWTPRDVQAWSHLAMYTRTYISRATRVYRNVTNSWGLKIFWAPKRTLFFPSQTAFRIFFLSFGLSFLIICDTTVYIFRLRLLFGAGKLFKQSHSVFLSLTTRTKSSLSYSGRPRTERSRRKGHSGRDTILRIHSAVLHCSASNYSAYYCLFSVQCLQKSNKILESYNKQHYVRYEAAHIVD
jgi:hypothetical protein